MKITANQRKFLIIWCTCHIIFLLCYLFKFSGDLDNGSYLISRLSVRGQRYSTLQDVFWPFCKIFDSFKGLDGMQHNILNGFLYGYDYTEFIVYMLLGFGIVFLPKLWNPSNK